MNENNNYRHLLAPLKVRNLTLRNRIVKAPYSSTNADTNGYVTESAIFHYEALAKGGLGLFINESVAIDPHGVTGSPRMAIWDDSFIPGQKRLAEVVHKYGVPILMQLHHAGPAYSTGAYGGAVGGVATAVSPRASSTLTAEQLPGRRPNLPQGLTKVEIGSLIDKFVSAAERAQKAGFDGVELHFAASYLVNSFLSRAWNRRTDEYGGSIENRSRFAAEVVRRIRRATGDGFVIGARMNGAEHGARFGDGLTYEETSQIARVLEDAGVDLLHIIEIGYNDAEWIGFPEQSIYPEVPKEMSKKRTTAVFRRQSNLESATTIKGAVSIPIIMNSGMDFLSAERVLRNRHADLVSFARLLIADPDAPNKLHAGTLREIRPCTRCMTCFDGFMRSEHERCRVNAAFAKEKELQIVPAAIRKNVLVIGGGPAGLEAARVATLRGHNVTLYERQHFLGGLMPLASIVKEPFVDDIGSFIGYLKHEMRRLGIRIQLGTTVDASLIGKLSPDAVILATGSKLQDFDLPGLDSSNVVTTNQLMKQVRLPLRIFSPALLRWATTIYLPVGKRVIILGGLMQGIELAEFLVRRGREVVVTESGNELGTGILDFHRTHVLKWLESKGCLLLKGVTYQRIDKRGLHIATNDGGTRLIEGDTIVALSVRAPDNTARNQLAELVPELYVVGDCDQPGMMVDAVESAYRAACAL